MHKHDWNKQQTDCMLVVKRKQYFSSCVKTKQLLLCHTRLTLYIHRALQYDSQSWCSYEFVLEALRSVLVTLRGVLVTA